MRDNEFKNELSQGHMSQEMTGGDKSDATPQNNAARQRQHVKRKQESHTRLQCWISNRHAAKLSALGQQLEDSQASLIEQAIDLLYQHELGTLHHTKEELTPLTLSPTAEADTVE